MSVAWLFTLGGSLVLFVALTYLLAPRGVGGLFGVEVPQGFEASPGGQALLRQYRRAVVAWSLAAGLAGAAAALALDGAVAVRLGSPVLLLQLVGCSLAWSAARRAALPHAVAAAPVSVRRAALVVPGGHLSPLFDLAGLLPLAAAGLRLQARWDDIPARFATHWTPAGPDGWVARTPGAVVKPLLFGVGTLAVLAGLRWTLLSVVPSGTSPRARANRALTNASVVGAGWFMAAVMAAGALTPLTGSPTIVLLTAVAGVALLSGALLWGLARLGRLPADPGPAAPASAWRWGGQLYLNPADPALWVPKAMGVGYTVNLGHPRGKLTLALLVAVPTVLLLGLALLER